MMPNGLMTIQHVLADVTARRRRARVAEAMQFGARSLDQLNVDERNIEAARASYFNLAVDRARSHHNAAPTMDELLTLHLQELALREAADMIASRIRTACARRRASPGQ